MIKRSILSSELFNYNSVGGTIGSLCSNYLLFDRISNDELEDERNINYEEFMNMVDIFNIDNSTIVIQRPKEEE